MEDSLLEDFDDFLSKDYFVENSPYGVNASCFYSPGLYDLIDENKQYDLQYGYDYCGGYTINQIFEVYKYGVKNLDDFVKYFALINNVDNDESKNIWYTIYNKLR